MKSNTILKKLILKKAKGEKVFVLIEITANSPQLMLQSSSTASSSDKINTASVWGHWTQLAIGNVDTRGTH